MNFINNLLSQGKGVIVQLSAEDLKDFANTLISNKQATPSNQKPDIGGIQLAMEVTGWADATIYAKTAKNEIPHFKKGNRLYFSRRQLEQWIIDGKVKTQSEIAEEMDSFLENKSR